MNSESGGFRPGMPGMSQARRADPDGPD